MNTREYLLTCLIEECAKVQKEATKALRFGLDDQWTDKPIGADGIVNEFHDLMAVFNMLTQDGIIPTIPCDRGIKLLKHKKERVLKCMDYARDRGVLE